MLPTRDDAWKLLTEWVSSESLRKHCLAVEAAMRACAPVYGGDPETWGLTGLLHDFDYERYPDIEEHARKGSEVLRERGYPEEVVRAILAHNDATNVPRESVMEKCLAAVDELCGFVVATAYVRPAKFDGMTVTSIDKNLKKKGFAAKISREEIERGIVELGVDRVAHIERVIRALRAIASVLGF